MLQRLSKDLNSYALHLNKQGQMSQQGINAMGRLEICQIRRCSLTSLPPLTDSSMGTTEAEQLTIARLAEPFSQSSTIYLLNWLAQAPVAVVLWKGSPISQASRNRQET